MPASNIEHRTSKSVRTRFAPSPTGALHAGTVRTALFAWLTARHSGGQFILRIEDTDRNREVEGSVQNITDSLSYLGLDWDEGPDKDGPYYQSQRLEIYSEWGQKLVDKGLAYADPYSKDELEKFRTEAQGQKKPFLYRNHRPENPPAWDGSQPLRFRSEPKSYKWQDEVMGQLQTGPEVVDDFIIIKTDGFPTYNFAHIIDDYLMQITHVVRSQEFISSMPIFLNLYDALGLKWPIFATVPIVLGVEGNRKLSKREGAKQLLEYKAMGILPEALMNCLATTGWNDGTEQEIFSAEELIKKFDLSRVQRGGARFDEQRLLWMNGHYIRQLSNDELYKLVEKTVDSRQKTDSFWPVEAKDASEDYKKAVLGLVQERLKFLAELPELTSFFFTEPGKEQVLKLYKEPVDKQLVKNPPDYKTYLDAVINELSESDFSPRDIQNRLNKLLDALGTKPAVLFPVIRIAITGSGVSPEIFNTLHVLGKKETLKRLKNARALLQ